jgi:hypothetical protein
MDYLSKMLENENLDINYLKFSLMHIRCIVSGLEDKGDLTEKGFTEELCLTIINYLLYNNDIEVKVSFNRK